MKHYRKILFMLGMVTTLNTNLMAFGITSNAPETGELNWVENNIDYYLNNRNSTRPTMKFLNTAFNWGKPSTYWDGLGSGANGGHQSVTTRDFLNRCTAAGSDCRQLWSVDHYNQSTGTVVNYTRKYLYKGVPVYATEFEEHGARHDRQDLYHGLLLDRGYLNTIGVSNTVIDNPENNATVIRNLFPGNASLNIDGKANTDASNINTPDWKNKIGLTNNGNDTNYLKVDGSNLNDGNRGGLISSLTTGSSIDNPTNTLVTDTTVKYGLDRKANNDLSNVNFGGLNQNTKDSITNIVSANIPKGSVVSNSLTVTGGTFRVFGLSDLEIEMSQSTKNLIDSKVSTADYNNNNIRINNELNNKTDISTFNSDNANINNILSTKAEIDGSNITSQTDKESFRNALNIHNKNDYNVYVYNTLNNSTGGDITPYNTLNVTGDTIFNYINNNMIDNRYYDELEKMVNRNSDMLNGISDKLDYVNERTAAAIAVSNIPYLTEKYKMSIGFGAGFAGKANVYGMAVSGTGKVFSYKAGAFVSGRGRVTANITTGIILGR